MSTQFFCDLGVKDLQCLIAWLVIFLMNCTTTTSTYIFLWSVKIDGKKKNRKGKKKLLTKDNEMEEHLWRGVWQINLDFQRIYTIMCYEKSRNMFPFFLSFVV